MDTVMVGERHGLIAGRLALTGERPVTIAERDVLAAGRELLTTEREERTAERLVTIAVHDATAVQTRRADAR
jgi:hypothetical protein